MAEEKTEKKLFELPSGLKDKIEYAMPHIQAFHFHGRKVVLAEQNEAQLLKLAQSKDCAVLQLKDKGSAKSAPAPAPSPAPTPKETESKDSKKPETSGKK
jgi:hypothetical protein